MIENMTNDPAPDGDFELEGATVHPDGGVPEGFEESPAGAEEVEGDPEKPEFGEDFDEAGPDATEDQANFDADEDASGVQPA